MIYAYAKEGMTLIELIVILAIIAILASIIGSFGGCGCTTSIGHDLQLDHVEHGVFQTKYHWHDLRTGEKFWTSTPSGSFLNRE